MGTDDNKTKSSNGLSAGAVVGIIVACVFLIIVFSISAFFIYKRIQRRRKHHGEYRPQNEEEIHAKGLPPTITPPNPPHVDGLI